MSEPRLPAPQRYRSNPGGCRGFLNQCALTLELQPSVFPTDQSQVAYVIMLLRDTTVGMYSTNQPMVVKLQTTRGSRVLWIRPSEQSCRMRERCCLYWGKPGHFQDSCPELEGKVRPYLAAGEV